MSGSPHWVFGLDSRARLRWRRDRGKVLVIGTMAVIKIIDRPEFDRFV